MCIGNNEGNQINLTQCLKWESKAIMGWGCTESRQMGAEPRRPQKAVPAVRCRPVALPTGICQEATIEMLWGGGSAKEDAVMASKECVAAAVSNSFSGG